MNVFRLPYICRMMRCSGYCAIAMLTVIGRLFLRDEPDASFELCGSMLTLACAFAVLTGGLSMCYSLERRLRSTQQLQTPQWCQDLLQAVQSDMVWGQTTGKPRHNKNDAEEFAEESDTVNGFDATQAAPDCNTTSNMHLTGSLPDAVRASMQTLGLGAKLIGRASRPWLCMGFCVSRWIQTVQQLGICKSSEYLEPHRFRLITQVGSSGLPQCHAYVPGTRLELQSPARQDW